MPRRRSLPVSGLLGLALAACGGEGAATACPPPSEPDVVAVCGTDQLAFVPSRVSAWPGEVTIALTCQRVAHDFVLAQGDVMVAECTGGDTAVGSTDLTAGEHDFYCSVPGHRSAGMEGTLTVAG